VKRGPVDKDQRCDSGGASIGKRRREETRRQCRPLRVSMVVVHYNGGTESVKLIQCNASMVVGIRWKSVG